MGREKRDNVVYIALSPTLLCLFPTSCLYQCLSLRNKPEKQVLPSLPYLYYFLRNRVLVRELSYWQTIAAIVSCTVPPRFLPRELPMTRDMETEKVSKDEPHLYIHEITTSRSENLYDDLYFYKYSGNCINC